MPGPRTDRRGAGAPTGSRDAIVEAAGAEVNEVGARRASVRSVARRVGMTHQSVAYHFPTRSALLTAVAVEGHEQLARKTEGELAAVPSGSPLGSHVIAAGVAYVEFAREHRALFDLMLTSDALDETDPQLIEQRVRLWQLLSTTVETEVAGGWGGGVGADDLAYMSWSVVHGVAMLGGFGPGEPSALELLRTFNSAIRQG